MKEISVLIPTSPSVRKMVDFDRLRIEYRRHFGLNEVEGFKFKAIYFCLGRGFQILSNKEDMGVHYIGFRTRIWIFDLFVSFLLQIFYLSLLRLFKGKCIIFIAAPYLGLTGVFIKKILRKVILCVRVMGDTPSHLREVSGIKFASFVLLRIEEFVLRSADIIIANAEFTKSLALQRGGKEENIILVPSPVFDFKEPEQIEVEQLRSRLDSNRIILCVAQLVRRKGIQHLLRAFKTVLENSPDCRLVIVGDGDYKVVLENLAYSLGIRDKVFFEGRIVHAEVFKYYQASDIFVLPSIIGEGRPVVLTEAGLCKKPIIASFNAGSDVIKDGENGFLVPPADEDSLARKILLLLGDEELRRKFGQAAYNSVWSYYEGRKNSLMELETRISSLLKQEKRDNSKA